MRTNAEPVDDDGAVKRGITALIKALLLISRRPFSSDDQMGLIELESNELERIRLRQELVLLLSRNSSEKQSARSSTDSPNVTAQRAMNR